MHRGPKGVPRMHGSALAAFEPISASYLILHMSAITARARTQFHYARMLRDGAYVPVVTEDRTCRVF